MSTISHVQTTGCILADERHELIADATLTRDAAEAEGRDLTPAESGHIKECLDRAKKIRQMPLYKEWGALPQPQISSPADPMAGVVPRDASTGSFPYHRSGGGSPIGGQRSLVGLAGRGTAAALFGASHDRGGFGDAGDFLKTVSSGLNDRRLNASSTIGVDSEGGFLVPTLYAQDFIDGVLEKAVLLNRVRLFRMNSDTLKISGFDGNDHSAGLFGGLDAGWEPELPTLTGQTPLMRQITFTAKKAIILNQTSNELLQDGMDFLRLMNEALASSMSWKIDDIIINGNGSGQPLGILAANSTITQDKVASQTAATIWFENIINMMARLAPASWNDSIWLTHPSCVPQLFRMDAHAYAGASTSDMVGDLAYIPFKESNGSFSLLGRPCFVTEKCQSLGTAGDIILVDPKQYGLAMRQEIVVEKSAHAGFSSDSVWFRAKMRVDGQPLWASAITPANGSDTLSWAITLETRD